MPGYRKRHGLAPFSLLTPEQKQERLDEKLAKHDARGGGFFWRAQETVRDLVQAAEGLFPQDGRGPERREWVVEQAVKLIKTAAGDAIERAVVLFLIELTLDLFDGHEIQDIKYDINDHAAEP